jgi:hypothetical protein
MNQGQTNFQTTLTNRFPVHDLYSETCASFIEQPCSSRNASERGPCYRCGGETASRIAARRATIQE